MNAGSREITLQFNLPVDRKTGTTLSATFDFIVIIERADESVEDVRVESVVQPNGSSDTILIRINQNDAPQASDKVTVTIVESGAEKIQDLGGNSLKVFQLSPWEKSVSVSLGPVQQKNGNIP